ncbi:hypothetical protein ABS784_12935 [Geobacillus sp. G4]|uniref:Uncharacterized protein n=3 Tax=Geobacillus thermoleovorans group TaxID=1505648 RepID=Q5KYB8_GEOKA|nr:MULTISPECIES: hypothetical protein [Geobacillus]AUI35153.1 hypothetical protein CWI35_00255 [[Bacillus] caldolyticus]AWO75778.1 hypothetical protein C1N76_15515 [Geobacillus thermoleovorans]MED3667365.1 hypothetical protein [Geobacillus kaustophilus]OQP14248.1 hypothetical protein B1692_04440 [Geobacillus thermoleovorans]OQP21642.1 hypothetical protein B1694_11825 [Geobacillus zalihae]
MTKKKRKRYRWNEPGCTAQQQLCILFDVHGTFGTATWKKHVVVQTIIIGVDAHQSLSIFHRCGARR